MVSRVEEHQILAYKVNYLMGVRQSELTNRFGPICEADASLGYFAHKPFCKKFRAVAGVYFTILRQYSFLDIDKPLPASFVTQLEDRVKEVDLNYEVIWNRSRSVTDALHQLVNLSASLLNKVFEEVECILSRKELQVVIALADVLPENLARMEVLLKSRHFYIMSHPLFNDSFDEMFGDDREILRRIAVYLGESSKGRLPYDESALAKKVVETLRYPYLLHPIHAKNFYFFVVDESVLCGRLISFIQKCHVLQNASFHGSLEECKERATALSNLGEKFLVVTGGYDSVPEVLSPMDGMTIGLVCDKDNKLACSLSSLERKDILRIDLDM